MDSNRFDELTRLLARKSPRRSVLRAIIGLGVAGGVPFRVDARTSRTRPTIPPPPPPETCPGGADRCAGTCCPEGQGCCNGACCAGTCENGLCCPPGTTNCADSCCDAGAYCCGSICCNSADLCSDSGRRCCEPGTAVCGEECCLDGQSCCGGECCDGECYREEMCCPWENEVCNGVCCAAGEICCGGACCSGACTADGTTCCAGGSDAICAGVCCLDHEKCCLVDGCCGGECIDDDRFCCPAGGDACGADCCNPATEECCTNVAGQSLCIPKGGCCTDQRCEGDAGCAGICDQEAHLCRYPSVGEECGTSVCSDDGLGRLNFACDGAGKCKQSRENCGEFVCLNGLCLTTCEDGSGCASDVCLESGQCCPAGRTCPFTSDHCCPADPEHPGIGCCPADSGCCECFTDRTGPFCCGESGSTELCKSPDGWENDICIVTTRYMCVDGMPWYRDWVCDGNVRCDKPCCGGPNITKGPGGICCSEGTECAGGTCQPKGGACQTDAAGNSTGCLPGFGCTQDQQCSPGEGCVSKGTCCPNHRVTNQPSPGAPWGDVRVTCCGVKEAGGPACDTGNPFCHQIPDITCTALYSFRR